MYDIGGSLIAEYNGPATNGGTSYLTTDHLGSTRVVTRSDQSVVGRHDYLPFGEEIFVGRTTGYNSLEDTSQKFTSKERDSESGLDYFEARYYSSAQARYTSPDPLFVEAQRLGDPQQLNIYAYTRNNPLKFIDPLGLDITVTGSVQDEYIKQLQRKVSFTIQTNSNTNKVQIVDKDGKVLSQKDLTDLGKTLKGADLAVFNAITDTKNHVTIDTGNGKDDPAVFFGSANGATHKIDFADIAKLDKAGVAINGSDVVLHETIEAYGQAQGKSLEDAHNAALEFGPAIGVPRRRGIQEQVDAQGNITGTTTPWSIDGKIVAGRATFVGFVNITVRFETPIPRGALPPKNAFIVDVKK